jgi:hypothetical protein
MVVYACQSDNKHLARNCSIHILVYADLRDLS